MLKIQSTTSGLLSGLLALALALSGCHSDVKPFSPIKEREYYGVAVSQLPPPPTYNRIRMVYLPNPLPDTDVRPASESIIMPVFKFEVKDATIEEAARVLAKTARYSSYTSSIIADRKFSLEALGTIDELALAISKKYGVNAVVDHENREVRFLANGTVAPSLGQGLESSDTAANEPTEVKPDLYIAKGDNISVQKGDAPADPASGTSGE